MNKLGLLNPDKTLKVIQSTMLPIGGCAQKSPTASLDQAREQIKTAIKDFIEGNSAGKVLNLQAPAGVGESYCTTQMINELINPHVNGNNGIFWFGSMHDQFGDLGDLRKDNWVQIKGRSADNCMHVKDVRKLGNKGYGVIENYCKTKCKAMSKCKYFDQLKTKGHKFLPHQMLFYHDGSKAPYVVFDELVPNVFLETYELDSNEITRLGHIGQSAFWRAFSSLLWQKEELYGKNLYKVFDIELAKVIEGSDIRSRLKKIEFTENEGADVKNISDMPIYQMGRKIIDLMLSELDCIQTNNFNPRITVHPKHDKDTTKALIEIQIRKDPPEWLKDKPIILLGAKGAPELFQKVLKRDKADFITISPTVSLPKQVIISKVSNNQYSNGTLLNAGTRRRIANEVKQRIDSDLKTFLITHKDYEESFAGDLGLTATKYDANERGGNGYKDTGHYWAIRGLNAWKDYDQAIIIGAPIPNVFGIIRQAQALFWDDKPIIITSTKKDEGVYEYDDDRINWYLRSLREDELYQAIFRIRPLERKGRNEIKIIIVTSLPLEDIDPMVTHTFTIKTKKQITKEEKEGYVLDKAKALYERQGSFTMQELINASRGFTNRSKYEVTDSFVRSCKNRLLDKMDLIEWKDTKNNNTLWFKPR